MEIIIMPDAQAVAEHSAQWVCELMQKKPNAVLGLATGSTPIALYQRLIALHKAGQLSFKRSVTFNLDEYLGISEHSKQSYRYFMNTQLFEHIDVDIANTHLPACAENENPRLVSSAYEEKICRAGGIDLQILGIGANGHIGFNEPTSSLSSRTRVKTLTERTVVDNSRLFSTDEVQPRLALTMGIATIMEARHIVLLATGEHKAKAVRQTVEGPISAMCPASVLQLHKKAVIILDEAAASELEALDYYRWANSQNAVVVKHYGHFDDIELGSTS